MDLAAMLAVGGKSNSLGRVDEVVALVLADRSRLDPLYDCLSDPDAWTRMRAADALEKVCREQPDWLSPYVDRLAADFGTDEQASIRWHLAQIYGQVPLTAAQRRRAIAWLRGLLGSADLDWIVAANSMATLAGFTRSGAVPVADLVPLLQTQQGHKSKAVVKRATTLLAEFG
jgi:hypothetical protein